MRCNTIYSLSSRTNILIFLIPFRNGLIIIVLYVDINNCVTKWISSFSVNQYVDFRD